VEKGSLSCGEYKFVPVRDFERIENIKGHAGLIELLEFVELLGLLESIRFVELLESIQSVELIGFTVQDSWCWILGSGA
jgi:hypothetical protein